MASASDAAGGSGSGSHWAHCDVASPHPWLRPAGAASFATLHSRARTETAESGRRRAQARVSRARLRLVGVPLLTWQCSSCLRAAGAQSAAGDADPWAQGPRAHLRTQWAAPRRRGGVRQGGCGAWRGAAAVPARGEAAARRAACARQCLLRRSYRSGEGLGPRRGALRHQQGPVWRAAGCNTGLEGWGSVGPAPARALGVCRGGGLTGARPRALPATPAVSAQSRRLVRAAAAPPRAPKRRAALPQRRAGAQGGASSGAAALGALGGRAARALALERGGSGHTMRGAW